MILRPKSPFLLPVTDVWQKVTDVKRHISNQKQDFRLI